MSAIEFIDAYNNLAALKRSIIRWTTYSSNGDDLMKIGANSELETEAVYSLPNLKCFNVF